MAAAIFSLLLFCLALHVQTTLSSPTNLQILHAERQIDLTSHIVRVYLTLKVENIGVVPASEVLLAFAPAQFDNLAVVKAAVVVGKKRKKSYVPLEVNPTELPDAPNGTKYYAISLLNPLSNGESTTLEILYILTHSLEPFPVEISQSESQLVYYHDSATVLSPYYIKEQATLVKTPTKKVESFTTVEPTDRTGTELKYGPYEDHHPYSYSPVIIHFENNHPFAVVEELEREIEISHWGSVQVTERYILVHAGAKHKGVFSRVEYQSKPTVSGVSSFKHLLAELPPRVHSVYRGEAWSKQRLKNLSFVIAFSLIFMPDRTSGRQSFFCFCFFYFLFDRSQPFSPQSGFPKTASCLSGTKLDKILDTFV